MFLKTDRSKWYLARVRSDRSALSSEDIIVYRIDPIRRALIKLMAELFYKETKNRAVCDGLILFEVTVKTCK